MLDSIYQYTMNLSNWVPAWMNNWFSHLVTSPQLIDSKTYLPPFLMAMALGTLLGLERRKRHKVAGVRTNMLVCVSACLITMIGLVVFDTNHIGDPARLPAQLLAGIAFLGAGVIWKNGWKTQGLTTSAMILYATGIGICCGFGYLLWATLASVIVVVYMQLSYWIFPPDDTGEHVLRIVCPRDKFEEARQLFPKGSAITRYSRSTNDSLEFRMNVKMTLRQLDQIVASNVNNEAVTSIEVIDESSA
ncbi:MAG: MgtC/SapB family protein [Candidatus Obscuribacter phosphatis]|uniref:MgtC/SapB family protein n=1 Tax=Candidatus Obscuribacter phosphatis TaxID=1906157 RepID=A0A8J7TN38_9BACT|nr:MgtC/SapB family protein [Candidatus Obscuribacter phosphatis]